MRFGVRWMIVGVVACLAAVGCDHDASPEADGGAAQADSEVPGPEVPGTGDTDSAADDIEAARDPVPADDEPARDPVPDDEPDDPDRSEEDRLEPDPPEDLVVTLPPEIDELLDGDAIELCGTFDIVLGGLPSGILRVEEAEVSARATATRIDCGWKGQISATNLAGDPTTWDYLIIVVHGSESLWQEFDEVIRPLPEDQKSSPGAQMQQQLFGFEMNGDGVLARLRYPYVLQVYCACAEVEPSNDELFDFVVRWVGLP